MDMSFDQVTNHVAETAMAEGAVSPEDVLALRRVVWGEGDLTRDKIEAILAINLGIAQPGPEWTEFLVEALTVWLVDLAQPEGYVDEGMAQWLVSHLAAANRQATVAELEMLVKIEEKAVKTPGCLRDFALTAFASAVQHAGHVDAVMAARLRRLIFAEGSDEPGHVSEREADLLFRLKDIALGQANAPEWKQLFVQGVANHLQGCHNFVAPSAEREAELEGFMNRKEPGVLGFMGQMAKAAENEAHGRFGDPRFNEATLRAEHIGYDKSAHHSLFGGHDDELLGHDLEAEAKADAEMTSDKTGWLDREINADGKIDEFEAALLEFMRAG